MIRTKSGVVAEPSKFGVKRWVYCAFAFMGIVSICGLLLLVRQSDPFSSETQDIEELIEQATLAQRRGNHEKVVELLTDQIDELYDRPGALRIFALSQLQVPQKGNAHVSKSMRVLRRVKDLLPNDLDANSRLFELSRRTRDLERAERYGRELLQLTPDHSSLRVQLIEVMVDNDSFEDALELADEAIGAEPGALSAYELRFRAMLGMGIEEAEILQFIRETVERPGATVSSRDLLLAYAQVCDDGDDLTRLLDQSMESTPTDEESAIWLVRKLEQNGRPEDAIRILETAVAEQPDAAKARRSLIYRYWQQARFEEVVEEIDLLERVGTLSDEILVLRALAAHFLDNPELVQETMLVLVGLETQLARVWLDVLHVLTNDEASGSDLLAVTEQSIQRYPQSAYLLHLAGVAHQRMGEVDLAIETFRRAVRVAPRWVVPRIAVSRLLLQRRMNQAAFAEAATALQENPRLPAAVEVAILSSVNLVTSGKSFAPDQAFPIRQTLNELIADESRQHSKDMLVAIGARLDGREEDADASIRDCICSNAQLALSELEVLRALAKDPKLVGEIDTLAGRQFSWSSESITSESVRISKEESVQAAVEHIREFDFSPSENPELSREIAIGVVLSKLNDPTASKHWLDLTERYSRRPQLLRLALSQPSLANQRSAQREIIDRLRACSVGSGVAWKIADAKWTLSGSPSQKSAAEAALRLNEVIKQAPTSVAAYRLLAEAYDRLGQPQRSATVLQDALDYGADSPELRIDLAERYIDSGQAPLATSHAFRAGASADASAEVRRRSVVALLRAEAYEKATQLMRRDLPSTVTDSDDDFEFLAAFSMAAAKCGKADLAKRFLSPMAGSVDRWFDLWVAVAIDGGTSAAEAVSWLEMAEQWVGSESLGRRRTLARAWSSVARREHHDHYLREAIRVLEPVAKKDNAAGLAFEVATLYTALGDEQLAIGKYTELIEVSDPKVRGASLNNLASLLASDEEQLARSEDLARQAVKTDPRVEYVDTLAEVLIARQRPSDAISILETYRSRFPGSSLLRVRLGEAFLDSGRIEEARTVVSELEASERENASLSVWRRINKLRSDLGRVAE